MVKAIVKVSLVIIVNEDRTEFQNYSFLMHTPLYELVLEMLHRFRVFEMHMNFYSECEMCYVDSK